MTLYTCDTSVEKALRTLAVKLANEYWDKTWHAQAIVTARKLSHSHKVFRIDITVTEDTGAAGNFRSGDGGE